jgi:tungstate transport system substrate-binding protein
MKIRYHLLFIALLLSVTSNLYANELIIQSTTSTRDSGFFKYLLPKYPLYDSLIVKTIAVGTGQAIMNSRNCDGDLLIVHDEKKEFKFMDDGYGIERHKLMYNDFVIIGPIADPASIKKSLSPADAFIKIYNNKSKYISRADSSGTHAAEMKIWRDAQIQPNIYSGSWYLETGQGMGQSLNIAIALNAYILVDRSSWLKFSNKKNHKVLYSNKAQMRNSYGMILIDPKKCPDNNYTAAKQLFDWLSSDDAKSLINEYSIDGSQLFYSY